MQRDAPAPIGSLLLLACAGVFLYFTVALADLLRRTILWLSL